MNHIMVIYPDFVELVDNLMWDLKLLIFDTLFYLNFFIYELLFKIFNAIDPLLQNGLFITNWKIFYQFPQNMSFFFGIKFCLAIGFLILIRGGTPRYRYDYLTKLGWLKFLGFIVLAFFSSLFIIFIF
jgi:NADH:ubiquinone oxidoreductase subunit H